MHVSARDLILCTGKATSSELRLNHFEYSHDPGMGLGLLTDTQNQRSSHRDVVTVVLPVIGAMDDFRV